MSKNYTAETRPWRTLVRVVMTGRTYIQVVVPAWHSTSIVSLDRDDIPEEILARLLPGVRTHAQVNIGAAKRADLRFSAWEQP